MLEPLVIVINRLSCSCVSHAVDSNARVLKNIYFVSNEKSFDLFYLSETYGAESSACSSDYFDMQHKKKFVIRNL